MGSNTNLPATTNLQLNSELPSSLNFDLSADASSNKLPASLNLQLCKELPTSLNFDLSVNPCGPSSIQEVSGSFTGSIAPKLSSFGAVVITGDFQALANELILSADGEWDANVFRGVVNYSNIPYEDCDDENRLECLIWEFSDNLKLSKSLKYSDGLDTNTQKCVPIKNLYRKQKITDESWEKCSHEIRSICESFICTYPKYLSENIPWDLPAPIQRYLCGSFIYASPKHKQSDYIFEQAEKLQLKYSGSFNDAKYLPYDLCFLYQIAKHPKWLWPPPSEPDSPDIPGFEGDTDFDLHCLLPDPIWGSVLFFLDSNIDCGRARTPWWLPPGTIPIREVYIVVNTASIIRVSDGEEIQANRISISADYDSWCWAFTASIDKSSLDLVAPSASGAVEVEITINGLKWRMLVEGWSEDTMFVSSSVTIKGRSLTAALAKPYAQTRDYIAEYERTARQLVEEELSRPDAATGFSVTWDLADWNIPAGAFSYHNFTPLAAISEIIKSVNGVLLTHPVNKELQALSRYKHMPWNWSSLDASEIDLVLPDSVILRSSAQWVERPLYNGIYVMGTKYGVTGKATLDSTDGSFLHPPVANPLITDSDAVLERAKSELGQGGKKENINLELPMIPDIGQITPGMYVEVVKSNDTSNRWRGLVREIGINVARSGSIKSNIQIVQSIGLEKYHG